jgi:hypothetical protein
MDVALIHDADRIRRQNITFGIGHTVKGEESQFGCCLSNINPTSHEAEIELCQKRFVTRRQTESTWV